MIMHVANLRQNYTKAGLHEDDVSDDPMVQFATWFQQATETNEIREPNAMVLSSVGPDRKPSSRVVLLKDFSDAGLTFFTNYASQKGLELTGTQYAALVFWWEPLERQVRIEGTVEKLPPERSDEYFASRPRKSQIGAWASAQSQAIANREVLEQRFKDLEAEYADKDIPRPDHWGGFLVKPEKIEFWQGRPSRLHDRLVFTLQGDLTWQRQRLAP